MVVNLQCISFACLPMPVWYCCRSCIDEFCCC